MLYEIGQNVTILFMVTSEMLPAGVKCDYRKMAYFECICMDATSTKGKSWTGPGTMFEYPNIQLTVVPYHPPVTQFGECLNLKNGVTYEVQILFDGFYERGNSTLTWIEDEQLGCQAVEICTRHSPRLHMVRRLPGDPEVKSSDCLSHFFDTPECAICGIPIAEVSKPRFEDNVVNRLLAKEFTS